MNTHNNNCVQRVLFATALFQKMRLFDLREFSSTQYLYSFWYLQIHTFQAQFQVDSFISFVLRGRKQVEQNK